MTPCDGRGEPDLDALVLKGRQLINAGMRSVVYCGSMGDWPLLTDEQRQEGVCALIDAGIPVIVGTGAQNTLQASSHARHALENGASGLMIIPRVLSRGSSHSAQKLHFEDFENNFFTGFSLGLNIKYESYKFNIGVKNLGSIGLTHSITLTKLFN